MKQRKQCIKLSTTERDLLIEHYLENRIPIDQFEKRPQDLKRFVREWAGISGRSDSPEDLIHYMKTQRKNKKWVTFEGNHLKSPSLEVTLTDDETLILVDIYEENVASVGLGSDCLSHDSEIAALIEKEFSHRTRRRVAATVLTAILTGLRKRKNLPHVNKSQSEEAPLTPP